MSLLTYNSNVVILNKVALSYSNTLFGQGTQITVKAIQSEGFLNLFA